MDITLISEPNIKLARNGYWISDQRADAAIKIVNKRQKILDYGDESADFVWTELERVVLYSCYVSPNSTMHEFETFLYNLGTSITGHRKRVVIEGDFNAKAKLWVSEI